MALRPQTLPAAVAPVLVGTGLASHDGVLAVVPALAALLGAALIQTGTNLANDYYDAVHGADTDDRDGFTRVTQAGLLSPQSVKLATAVAFLLAVLIGGYLVWVGGLPIVVIGVASVASGIAYTAGPYPLGYHGLGDPFVFVFFGPVAVAGSYYVQAVAQLEAVASATAVAGHSVIMGVPPGTLPAAAVLAGVPMGALATNILVINNIRDRDTDMAAGKRTLAVRLGYRASRIQFVGLLGLAYLSPVVLWAGRFGYSVLLGLLSLPYAVLLTRTVLARTDGDALNPALEQMGRLLALFAVLFTVGLVV